MRAGLNLVRLILCSCLAAESTSLASATNVLVWQDGKVDADVRGWELPGLLEGIAGRSGWQVYHEGGLTNRASAKFKGFSPADALRRLLGDLNFTILPQSNNPVRLYVFKTDIRNATIRVLAKSDGTNSTRLRKVPNELIVRFKNKSDAEKWAQLLGAKILGSIPELNAYRLQFSDEEATQRAREQLTSSPDIMGVDDNYFVDVPFLPESVTGMSSPEIRLALDPPKADGCKVIVGLVDTAVQTLSPELEPFIKERIAIAGQSANAGQLPLHGTAMANSMFQAIQRTGPRTSVQLVSVDVFGTESLANSFNVAAGMIAAANRGATVINTSLGGYADSTVMRDAVQQLGQHNIPVFAAVGNDGSANPFFPAAYPQVISVTALEQGQVASYANVGTQPDAAAPGAVLFSHNGRVYGSRGTSVSSAVATGLAAGVADSKCAPWSQVIPSIEKSLAVPKPR